MSERQPVVYILHGEDKFAIEEIIQELSAGLGDDRTMVDMNTTLLDGRSHSLDDLQNALLVLPFLAPYRLVIYTNPLSAVRTADQRKKFTAILDGVPQTTRLVLSQDHILMENRGRSSRRHWLEKWGMDRTDKAQVRGFPIPVGAALGKWVLERAKKWDGQFSLQAANLLAQNVGSDAGVLDQEVQKLLAYVGYERPVEGDDVLELTPKTAPTADFALVNALRNRDGRQALQVLHRELEDEEPLFLFFRVVHQFRQLLQAREIIENKGGENDVARLLKIHPYAARLAIGHARRFSMEDLEKIYHRLLDFDIAMKTGEMDGELAMDMLVTELTT